MKEGKTFQTWTYDSKEFVKAAQNTKPKRINHVDEIPGLSAEPEDK